MSTSAGTKVTKDPEAQQHPKNENPGMVTSDSLAGESVQGGGSFGANSDARGPSAQPSSSTTSNTTDTSSARVLNSAPTAGARQSADSGVAPSGGGAGTGSGPTYNTAAGGSATSASSGAAGTAPNYVNNPAPSVGDNFKPHGKNITEGGIPDDAPNASFNSEIGSKNDPARVALGGMQEADVPSAGVPGDRRNQVSNDGQFDALKETSA